MDSKKAAVFIILGQSNAVGHKVPMEEKDKISIPLKNVFGLHRRENQSFEHTQLCWSGYTSGGMNLGEEQDHTYSVPNCLAALWQTHIDQGNQWNLPDLYIIQIAIGAQGVCEGRMWYPDRKETLTPGVLGVVDISLFPFTKHIFRLLDDSFRRENKEYEIIGLHWRGGEGDCLRDRAYLSENLENIYRKIFEQFNAILNNPPTVLHKILCFDHMQKEDETGGYCENLHYINRVFADLERQYANITVFDPANAPQFVPDVYGNGIFIYDAIHFTPEVNQWVAETVLRQYGSRKK